MLLRWLLATGLILLAALFMGRPRYAGDYLSPTVSATGVVMWLMFSAGLMGV